MWRGRLIVAFVLLTISTVLGSSSNLNISELGQSFQYKCTFDAAVGNSPNFQGLCFSVSTPENKSQDLICLKPGDLKDSSDCLRDDAHLYDCCQKNINQTYFQKCVDGSCEFVLVTKYGRISSCDNTNNNYYCKFTVSSKTSGLTSSQVICIIMSTGTAEISSTINTSLTSSIAHNKTEAEISSTINPPLPSSIAHNKTKGDVTRTVSPGTTNHAGSIPFILVMSVMVYFV